MVFRRGFVFIGRISQPPGIRFALGRCFRGEWADFESVYLLIDTRQDFEVGILYHIPISCLKIL